MHPFLQLGARVRNTHTGYIGTVVAVTYWLQGPVRVTLQEQLVNTGEINLVDGKIDNVNVVNASLLELYVEPEPTKAARSRKKGN